MTISIRGIRSTVTRAFSGQSNHAKRGAGKADSFQFVPGSPEGKEAAAARSGGVHTLAWLAVLPILGVILFSGCGEEKKGINLENDTQIYSEPPAGAPGDVEPLRLD